MLIIGAGPVGLEAARVAAERGHKVVLCEASDKVGGQFRLAGLQPRRGQILELLDWYERQLANLQIELRLNTFVESSEIDEFGADEVIIATGSLPAETGYQRWVPQNPELAGLAEGNICSVEDVMQRAIVPGKRVVLIDEGGHWRGCGTAWYLAERGHEVTIVTPDTHVGAELTRTSADFPLRRTLARAGAKFFTESVVESWSGQSARIVSLLSGEAVGIEADTLVLAMANVSFDLLGIELDDTGIAHHEIGDCVAPRLVPFAFYEGRKLGLSL